MQHFLLKIVKKHIIIDLFMYLFRFQRLFFYKFALRNTKLGKRWDLELIGQERTTKQTS